MGQYVDALNAGFTSAAENLTSAGWSQASSMAHSAFSSAQGLIGAMGMLSIPFTPTTSGFTTPTIGYTVSLPAIPTPPDITFPAIDLLTDPALTPVTPVVPAPVPQFDADVPYVSILDRPAPLAATPPGNAPSVTNVTLPDAPTIVFPDAPLMELISIPQIPVINLPTFTAIAPDGGNIAAPNVDFVWNEDYYNSDLLRDVTNRLTTMLLGGTGLPVAIEQAIWDRGRAREDVIAKKAVQEAYEEFASRGFMLPGGVLAARLDEVWQKNREAASTYSRDVAIKQAELEIENLKFSVSTGIQLEGQLMAYAGQYAQRALEAAKTTVEVAINLLNAKVAVYNAQLQAYQTQAQVYRDLIQAEALKLEQYRTSIEAQKLIGEINMQAIQIYKTRIEALMSAVELYKAQLEGVKTAVETDRVRIEGFRATVDSYKALVDAKTSEYQAWAESIRGELAKVSAYETQARAYASLVDAYRTGETVKIENMKSEIARNELLIDKFKAEVQYLAEKIRAGIAQVDTSVKIYDGQARVYGAQISGEEARIRALAEQIKLIISAGTADAELKLKAANLNIEQLMRMAQIEAEGKKAAGAAAAQLAASAMSAFNLSAGVSANWGLGISNSLNENHNLST